MAPLTEKNQVARDKMVQYCTDRVLYLPKTVEDISELALQMFAEGALTEDEYISSLHLSFFKAFIPDLLEYQPPFSS